MTHCGNDYRYHDLRGKPRAKPAFREHASVQLQGSQAKLFFILYYLKNNPLQEALAFTFNMTQAKAQQWIAVLLPVLREALQHLETLPARNVEEWKGFLATKQNDDETLELWLDASERSIPRFKDYDAQKEAYSGKKRPYCKKHIRYWSRATNSLSRCNRVR